MKTRELIDTVKESIEAMPAKVVKDIATSSREIIDTRSSIAHEQLSAQVLLLSHGFHWLPVSGIAREIRLPATTLNRLFPYLVGQAPACVLYSQNISLIAVLALAVELWLRLFSRNVVIRFVKHWLMKFFKIALMDVHMTELKTELERVRTVLEECEAGRKTAEDKCRILTDELKSQQVFTHLF